MGDIKRKKNKFRKPKKLFDKSRIESENKIVLEYGLKNKKEIWKAESEVSKIRRRAKSLIPKTDEERNAFFEKLNKMGLKVKSTADALALTKEDLLDRRLQTQAFKRGFTKTPKEARQFIVHKKVRVDGKVVNIPSFFINSESENKISLVNGKLKEKKNE
jgi:small subunit ribosomal protein S4